MLKYSFFLLIYLFMLSCGLQKRVDPDILTPDRDGAGFIHGYNYTYLGLLVSSPWKYPVTEELKSKNLYYNDYPVFELQKNGKLKFWFQSDYLEKETDTIVNSDGRSIIRFERKGSDKLKLKNVYEYGFWKYNSKDSSILINFGANKFNLAEIRGKVVDINIEIMEIESNKTDDKAIKKKRITLMHH